MSKKNGTRTADKKVKDNIAKRARGKRIVVTLPSRLVRRIDKHYEPAERDRLIAGMLTEHLDKIETEIEQERKQAKRKKAVGSFFQKIGETFLP